MKLYLRSISDLIWAGVFALCERRDRRRYKNVPPARPYSQPDAVVTSITRLRKGGTR